MTAGLLLLPTVLTARAAGETSGVAAGTVPAQLRGVGIDEHLDAEVPRRLVFTDDQGRQVKIADFLDHQRPVILTLNYYECPMLCTLQLNGLVEGMRGLAWNPGQEYELVTVSINPLETAALAKVKKRSYLNLLERPSAGPGWHFLVGDPENIRRLADSVGFRYRFDKETGEFAHAAALMVLTPDGRLARYLYGIEYPPKVLKLALLEASEGKIGSTWDRIILYCCRYDPQTRRYTPIAMNIMRLGGAATLILVGALLIPFWLRRRKRGAVRPGDSPSKGGGEK